VQYERVERIQMILDAYAEAVLARDEHAEARAVATFYKTCPHLKPGALESRREAVLAEYRAREDFEAARRLAAEDRRERRWKAVRGHRGVALTR
jgi:hypothetical protein